MKPSDYINESISGSYTYREMNDFEQLERKFDLLLKYLDEQWEKNKPCQHKDTYQVDSGYDVYYNVCNDCGILFLANPEK